MGPSSFAWISSLGLLLCLVSFSGVLSSASDGNAYVASYGLVHPTVLFVRVRQGLSQLGSVETYVYNAADVYSTVDATRLIQIGGQNKLYLAPYGCGDDHTTCGTTCDCEFRNPGSVIGTPLNLTWFDDGPNFLLSSTDDPSFSGGGSAPIHTYRKSIPIGPAVAVDPLPYTFDSPLEHTIYMEFSNQLSSGNTYTLSFGSSAGFSGLEGALSGLEFTMDDVSLESPAIHVNQLGYSTEQSPKRAFLSHWPGLLGGRVDGLKYDGISPRFRVVDAQSGAEVFPSTALTLRLRSNGLEDVYNDPALAPAIGVVARNYTMAKADVWEADFSGLSVDEGTFRLVVDGIGCSPEFVVGTGLYLEPFKVSLKYLYYARSGVPLAPPHAHYERPAPQNPTLAGSPPIYWAEHTRFCDVAEGQLMGGLPNHFESLQNESVPAGGACDAWGGWQDAGDWDQRRQSLRVNRWLVDLYQLDPEFFGAIETNIPASASGLPDILEEALFNTDFYRRLQHQDGGVSGGKEAVEHPPMGEVSWLNSQQWYCYAPDPHASFLYAADAANLARVLEMNQLNASLAQSLLESAEAAYAWAVSHANDSSPLSDASFSGVPPAGFPSFWANLQDRIRDAGNLAAADLYRLTGEQSYHDAYAASFRVSSSELRTFGEVDTYDQEDACWVYLQIAQHDGGEGSQLATNASLVDACSDAYAAEGRREANEEPFFNYTLGFDMWKDPFHPPWGIAPPKAVKYLRNNAISPSQGAIDTLEAKTAWSMGSNPRNLIWTSGLCEAIGRGHCIQNPLHLDTMFHPDGPITPPPGITVLGPTEPNQAVFNSDSAAFDAFSAALSNPNQPEQWPMMEWFSDFFWNPTQSEFTPQENIGPAIYTLGHLALARRSPCTCVCDCDPDVDGVCGPDGTCAQECSCASSASIAKPFYTQM